MLEEGKGLYKEFGTESNYEKFKEKWIAVCSKINSKIMAEKEVLNKSKSNKLLVVNRPNSHSLNYLWRTLE